MTPDSSDSISQSSEIWNKCREVESEVRQAWSSAPAAVWSSASPGLQADVSASETSDSLRLALSDHRNSESENEAFWSSGMNVRQRLQEAPAQHAAAEALSSAPPRWAPTSSPTLPATDVSDALPGLSRDGMNEVISIEANDSMPDKLRNVRDFKILYLYSGTLREDSVEFCKGMG